MVIIIEIMLSECLGTLGSLHIFLMKTCDMFSLEKYTMNLKCLEQTIK